MDAEPRMEDNGERADHGHQPPADFLTGPGPGAADTDPPGDIPQLVEALGMAWSTYCLYPDPREQVAWLRALEMMRSVRAYPVYAEVGAGTFVTEAGEVEGTRDGVARLVRSLFMHDVSAVSVAGPPRDNELLALFEALQKDVDEMRSLGGVRAYLINAGIEALEVLQRSMLADTDDDLRSEEARDQEVAGVIGLASDPGQFAANLLEESGHDPERLPSIYGAMYERVYGLVAAEDHRGREDVVQVFVEAFFFFPEEFQLPLLERFISQRAKPAFELILDQFSGHDLARLAGSLPQDAQLGLREYAEAAAGQDQRPGDLLQLMQSASEVKEARQAVAGRIGDMFGGDAEQLTGVTYVELREELSQDLVDNVGFDVLRQLMAVEDRDTRFRRLLRVWSGKVARSVRDKDLAEAASWLEAVLVEPTYPEARQVEVSQALRDMATQELIEGIVDLIDENDPDPGKRVLDVWGRTALELLIDRLAEEESAARRRVLIDLVSRVAEDDPKPVIRQLNDQRWYVVRNMVMVLGKTGRADVVPRLATVATSHRDHRVRVEALRALMPHEGNEGIESAIAALRDRHERVRQAALILLAGATGVHVDRLLVSVLGERRVAPEAKSRIVALLAERGTPQALRALDRLAKGRSLFGPGRALRVAARRALSEAS